MYNVVIIGAGGQGALADAPGSGNEHKVLSYANAVLSHGGYHLLGFHDYDLRAAMQAVNTWGGRSICSPGVRCDECEDLYSKADVIIVATPDDQHADILKALAKSYRPRLVICEKPLTTDLVSARELVRTYKEKGIGLMVNYTRRFLPKHREIRQLIQSGKWGKFINGYVYFNRGWMHTHAIDTARWIKGDLDGLRTVEIPTTYKWVYQMGLYYDYDFFVDSAASATSQTAITWLPDDQMMHVINNAHDYLDGVGPLHCTGQDALETIEETIRLMEVSHK